MALLFKYLFRSSISMFILFFFFTLPGIISNHIVTAKDPSKGNKESYLSDNDTSGRHPLGKAVYPRWGLTTGPLVNASEEKNTALLFQNESTQRNQADDAAQEEERIVRNTANIRYQSDAEDHVTGGTNTVRSQGLQDHTVPTPQLLKSNCISGTPEDDSEHPTKDTIKLYEVVDDILEHVIGVDQNMNDPEEIRMRAYVGERQSFGVQVILEDQTHFWESSLVREADEPTMEAFEASSPLEDSSFIQRHRDYVEEEAINEEGAKIEIKEGAKIEVKEGARLRLVCNVTGVPTYWVEWRRGANLSFPGGATVVGGRSVLLDYIGREDAGTYTCKATTPSGYAHTSGVSISVQYTPVVGLWARDVDIKKVELGCLIEGRPRPSSAWYMNNTKISSGNCPSNVEIRFSVLSSRFVLSVLSITDMTTANFAYYHCRASNSAGVSRTYVMVHDDTGLLDLDELANTRPVKHTSLMDNASLSSFMLGMVPPLYIGLYIIAYLGCYKTSISGGGTHGRFGAGIDMSE